MYTQANSREARSVENSRLDVNADDSETRVAGELIEKDWECIRRWFDEHKVENESSVADRHVWTGWSNELDGVCIFF